jgi:hypothetical protein
MSPQTPPPVKMPPLIFILEMTYLVLLIALLVVYKTDHAFRAALPPFGPLPVQIAWFGATGGVLAGLGGVYFHNSNWNGAYDYWHYSRPLVLTQLLFGPGSTKPGAAGSGQHQSS